MQARGGGARGTNGAGRALEKLHVLRVVGVQVDNLHDALDDALVHRVVVAARVLAPRIVRSPDLVGYVREHYLAVGLADGLRRGRRLDVCAGGIPATHMQLCVGARCARPPRRARVPPIGGAGLGPSHRRRGAGSLPSSARGWVPPFGGAADVRCSRALVRGGGW